MLDPQVLIALIRDVLRKERGNLYSPFVYGTFAGSETEDADLSKVTLTGGDSPDEARYVPKLNSVGSLTVGDTVLCVRSSTVPLTIVGRPLGDVSLATT